MLWKSLAFVVTIHSQSNKSVTHGSYKKLKHFSKDFSRTFQGLFKDQIYFSRTLRGMSCYLFNTMNHSVCTKLATMHGLNCTFQAFCCKTTQQNKRQRKRFNSVMSSQLHITWTRAFQLIYTTADQSGVGSHFGSCSAYTIILCSFFCLSFLQN